MRLTDRLRVLPSRGRLSVGALGLSLVLILSIAWGSGLFYLASRLGLDPRVRLSLIDGVHVYVGLVGGVFIAAKVVRVGLRYHVPQVGGVVRWQRWLSWGLLSLYSAIWLTGILLLLPFHGRFYGDLVNAHLMISVWALVPTTWHVWHYRRRAFEFLLPRRLTARLGRYWLGVALALIPALVLLNFGRALSQLPQVFGGAEWSPVAMTGLFLDRIAPGPDPGSVVATGDALYVSQDGVVWYAIDLPPGAAPAGTAPAVHVHSGHEPLGNLGLALLVRGGDIYVGASAGLYRSTSLQGDLASLALAGVSVRALAADPPAGNGMWAATSRGVMYSSDGGSSWTDRSQGLAQPGGADALAFAGGRLYAADPKGVYSWTGAEWQRSSSQTGVVDLSAAGPVLYATSSSNGVRLLSAGVWHQTASLASPHQHHAAAHAAHPQVVSLLPYEGRLYAAGTAFGVSASGDAGRTWTQLGGGMGDATVSQLLVHDGSLLAATSTGLYQLPLQPAPPPTAGWWLAVALAVVACGAAAVGIAIPESRRRRPARLETPQHDIAV